MTDHFTVSLTDGARVMSIEPLTETEVSEIRQRFLAMHSGLLPAILPAHTSRPDCPETLRMYSR